MIDMNMRHAAGLVTAAVLLLSIGGTSLHATPVIASAPIATPSEDSVAVSRTVERFHRALAAGDSGGVLTLLLPEALIVESGDVETLTEYRAHHLPADIEFARAVTSMRSTRRATLLGDAAWITATSVTQGTFRGKPVNSQGAELMVLARTPAGWRIAAIHWSSRRRGAQQ